MGKLVRGMYAIHFARTPETFFFFFFARDIGEAGLFSLEKTCIPTTWARKPTHVHRRGDSLHPKGTGGVYCTIRGQVTVNYRRAKP